MGIVERVIECVSFQSLIPTIYTKDKKIGEVFNVFIMYK